MPLLLRLKGYRFNFCSQELDEPPHVYVDKDGKSAKFWIESISVVRNSHFTQRELREIGRIISVNRLEFLRSWNAYFGHS
jgi:hypothetical protein